ncbi:MAG: hypothetical protein HY909_14275 [Deltaproteobacteria bacterium]|nr:hypothetical protein [Deltaproteobacteria bacterium]
MRGLGPLRALFLGWGLGVVGCSSDPPAMTDAGMDVGADLLPGDAGLDTARDVAQDTAPRTFFSPCTVDSQCPGGREAVCIRVQDGYPQGYCSRRCTTQANCTDEGECLPFGSSESRCFRRCDTTMDCRPGYYCFATTTIDRQSTQACFPLCTEDGQCPGSACNRWSRFCSQVNEMRGDNGAPCAAANECRSNRCIEELSSAGAPTGNLGGYCTSRCVIPEDEAYTAPMLPQADCPMGSVCTRDSTAMAGSIGTCRKACMENGDCRPGYICSHPSRGTDAGVTVNGFCVAMNCRFGMQRCPPEAECLTTRTSGGMAVSGVCQRSADGGAGDAATDAVTDAVADATADTTADTAATDTTTDTAADTGGAVDATADRGGAVDATADRGATDAGSATDTGATDTGGAVDAGATDAGSATDAGAADGAGG